VRAVTRPSASVLGLLLAAIACQGGGPGSGHSRERAAAWSTISQVSGGEDVRRPGLLSDAQLKAFFPDRLGDRLGQAPLGAMTRMGDRALSEATRTYGAAPRSRGPESSPPGSGRIELKIADARLEPHATDVIRSMAIGAEEPGAPVFAERLVLPGAIGYARYDGTVRVAQAQVVIADRIIASATVAQAEGPQEAAQALRALDTLKIAGLARAEE
jgi:hypothetical protein